jgi:Protein of unknown function (DUF2950)
MKRNGETSMKLQARNVTGSMLLAGILALGLIHIAGSGAQTVSAQATQAAQRTFSTPEQAGEALRAAAGAGDESTLAQILGPESKAVLSSGDAAEDTAALAHFVSKYDRMNRWVTMTDGSRVLYVGADNYPYPIPLAQNSSSQWYFNTAAGKDEILARRIGKNELLVTDTIYAMAAAEDLYFQSTSQYTDKILSTPGKQDGLYLQVSADQTASPLIFDGYSFRIVTGKSGYTIVAGPVTYGDSGIMTFALSKGGQIYQKDLGSDSVSVASYNPNDGWTLAE